MTLAKTRVNEARPTPPERRGDAQYNLQATLRQVRREIVEKSVRGSHHPRFGSIATDRIMMRSARQILDAGAGR